MSVEEDIFQEAVNLLGSPIIEWKFIGVEFNNDSPHLRYFPENGQVAISLSNKAKENNQQYLFQFTHELCHLFYPRIEYPSLKEHKTLVINEGISTYFSIKATGSRFNIEDHLRNDLKKNNGNYYKALVFVEKLLDLDGDAIKKLRSHQPRIDALSRNDFYSAKINATKYLINSLLSIF